MLPSLCKFLISYRLYAFLLGSTVLLSFVVYISRSDARDTLFESVSYSLPLLILISITCYDACRSYNEIVQQEQEELPLRQVPTPILLARQKLFSRIRFCGCLSLLLVSLLCVYAFIQDKILLRWCILLAGVLNVTLLVLLRLRGPFAQYVFHHLVFTPIQIHMDNHDICSICLSELVSRRVSNGEQREEVEEVNQMEQREHMEQIEQGGHSGIKCVQIPCRHVFHLECIEPWIKVACTCPLCRRDFFHVWV
jgi:hypothetical protein